MVAAVDDRQFGRAGDLAGEPHAPRAHDAAVGEERDLRTDVRLIRRGVLPVDHPALGMAELVAVVLQLALAGLVADGAVERVVEEQGFERLGLCGLGLRRVGDDDGAILDRSLAAGDDLRLHGGLAVLHLADFDEAHAATGDDGQGGVPAVVRDQDAGAVRRLDAVEAFLVADRDGGAVDVDGRHEWVGPSYQSPRQSITCGRRCGWYTIAANSGYETVAGCGPSDVVRLTIIPPLNGVSASYATAELPFNGKFQATWYLPSSMSSASRRVLRNGASSARFIGERPLARRKL